MGKASREGGLYYIKGIAVDSEGKAVQGAPKREPNTVAAEQPPIVAHAVVAELVKALRAPAEIARQPDRK